MQRSAPFALVLIASGILLLSPAQAYVARRTESGQPVRWDAERITLVVDPSVTAIDPEAIAAVTRAFAAWGAVSGASAPEVVITEGAVDEVGYRSERENRSTLRFLYPQTAELPASCAATPAPRRSPDGPCVLAALLALAGLRGKRRRHVPSPR